MTAFGPVDAETHAYTQVSELGVTPGGYQEAAEGQKLHRGLKNRHIQMIRQVDSPLSNFLRCIVLIDHYSIGGVIGTGLFLGTANALRHGGPVGLLLGYMAIGSICFSVMVRVHARQWHLIAEIDTAHRSRWAK